ncbi:MAG TPA: DUF192 domain-containing protein [Sphingorhabdus sp.]|nr:DUF192 domain-containing protein [Sphingorhabdus sp.]
MNRMRLSGVLALALLSACTLSANGESKAVGCEAGAAKGQSAAGLEQVVLCVSSGAKTHAFTTEIARTSAEQAKGMMFRTEMPDSTAMIFPFPQPRPASFWMKNTVIPLDIIFVRTNGTIESIAENTVPYSTDPVLSGEPVGAVLEIRGGLAAELGISAGDKVAWQSN